MWHPLKDKLCCKSIYNSRKDLWLFCSLSLFAPSPWPCTLGHQSYLMLFVAPFCFIFAFALEEAQRSAVKQSCIFSMHVCCKHSFWRMYYFSIFTVPQDHWSMKPSPKNVFIDHFPPQSKESVSSIRSAMLLVTIKLYLGWSCLS